MVLLFYLEKTDRKTNSSQLSNVFKHEIQLIIAKFRAYLTRNTLHLYHYDYTVHKI